LLHRTESWMNHPVVRNKTLLELTLPASHNAHSYVVDGFAKGTILERAVCCQSKSINHQLNLGIRALDIRVAENGGRVTTKHGGIECVDLETVLGQILNFLRRERTEIVCLRVKADKMLNQKWLHNLCGSNPHDIRSAVIKTLKRECQKLGPRIKHISLHSAKHSKVKELVENNQRLVLMFSELDHIECTYNQTKANKADTLLEKVRECSENNYEKSARNNNLKWLCLQVTSAGKALMDANGYGTISQLVAEKALESLNLERIMISRKDSEKKLFNFIGMDFVGHSENSRDLIQEIIRISQSTKPTRNPYEMHNYDYLSYPVGCQPKLDVSPHETLG